MELRENRMKRKLDQDKIATVAGGPLTPETVELLGSYGFDGAWIEAEHGPIDFGDIPDYTRACDLWGMTSVVRVNVNLAGVIYRTLDLGAQAIVVPHINTAEEARSVVQASKFHPLGQRGMYSSRQGIGVDNYYNKANSETLSIILIEDIIAIENLSEILTVKGIDVFFVAAGDLSQSMGLMGQGSHPDVQSTVDNAITQIAKVGKVAGVIAHESTLERYVDKGARFILTPWVPWLEEGAKSYLDKVASFNYKVG